MIPLYYYTTTHIKLINLNPVQFKSISFQSVVPPRVLGYHRSNKCLPWPYSNLYVLGNLLFSEIRFANSYVHIMCLSPWPVLSYMKYDFIPYPLHWYSDCVSDSLLCSFTKHIFDYQTRPPCSDNKVEAFKWHTTCSVCNFDAVWNELKDFLTLSI